MHKNNYSIILSRAIVKIFYFFSRIAIKDLTLDRFRLLNQLFLPLKITVFHYCLIEIFIVILTTPQNISYNLKQ